GAPRRTAAAARSVDEGLRLVLHDPVVRDHSAVVRPRQAGVLRAVRGQRPAEAADGDRELQHRRVRFLGVLCYGIPADRGFESGVQTRSGLHHLRDDSLTIARAVWWISIRARLISSRQTMWRWPTR